MINLLNKKIINSLIIIFLAIQIFIYIVNQKPLTQNFSQKSITVENFKYEPTKKTEKNIYGSATLLLCCWRGGGVAALLRCGSAAPGRRPAHGVQSPIP